MNDPSESVISNPIMARQDRGISNRKGMGNGVVTAWMNAKKPKSIDVAMTITAQEHTRGISEKFNTSSNGVIDEQR